MRPIFSPINPFQYYEMSYGLNVEMHKQVMHPHIIIKKCNDNVKNGFIQCLGKYRKEVEEPLYAGQMFSFTEL